jgi:hypothetical protein
LHSSIRIEPRLSKNETSGLALPDVFVMYH